MKKKPNPETVLNKIIQLYLKSQTEQFKEDKRVQRILSKRAKRRCTETNALIQLLKVYRG